MSPEQMDYERFQSYQEFQSFLASLTPEKKRALADQLVAEARAEELRVRAAVPTLRDWLLCLDGLTITMSMLHEKLAAERPKDDPMALRAAVDALLAEGRWKVLLSTWDSDIGQVEFELDEDGGTAGKYYLDGHEVPASEIVRHYVTGRRQ